MQSQRDYPGLLPTSGHLRFCQFAYCILKDEPPWGKNNVTKGTVS